MTRPGRASDPGRGPPSFLAAGSRAGHQAPVYAIDIREDEAVLTAFPANVQRLGLSRS